MVAGAGNEILTWKHKLKPHSIVVIATAAAATSSWICSPHLQIECLEEC